MRKALKRRKKAPRTIRRLLRTLTRLPNLTRTLLRLLTLNQNPTPTLFQLLTLFQNLTLTPFQFLILTLFQNRTQRRRRTRSRTWTQTLLRSCRNLPRRISRLWKSLPWTWIFLLAPVDAGAGPARRPAPPAGPGGLDAPAYDVTEAPNGGIIIEEHSYTRTVDILGLPVSFNLDDLTMRSALTAIFGEYTPKTQTVSTYYDGQLLDTSTEYVPGLAGMDMEWIAGVIVFTVLLYCFMKLLGGVFK